jgi:ABC-type transport system involved in multi-copper enzyme maturation permease subunit
MAHPTTPGAAAGRTGTASRGVHQYLALAIGAVYLLVGLAGFLVTGFDGFAEHDHERTLLGFAVNPLHNIVHLLIGALGLSLWRTSDRARTFGWILFVVYGLTFVYGLLVAGNDEANVLNINGADNGLHILSALAGLAIALWPRHRDGARSTR